MTRVHALAPVVALDIDGTMGDYHGHFVWFLRNIYLPREWGQISLDVPVRPWWKPEYKGEFSDALGMDKAEYRAAKLAFRQGGLKRCMPQFTSDNGRLLYYVQAIRQMGVQVWVCTARPWMRLDNIDPDTQYWLTHNAGPVDGLIFGEDKYADLIDHVGRERILGVVDDLPENIERAWELNLPALLRYGRHNSWWREDVEEEVAFGMEDVAEKVKEWKGKYDA